MFGLPQLLLEDVYKLRETNTIHFIYRSFVEVLNWIFSFCKSQINLTYDSFIKTYFLMFFFINSRNITFCVVKYISIIQPLAVQSLYYGIMSLKSIWWGGLFFFSLCVSQMLVGPFFVQYFSLFLPIFTFQFPNLLFLVFLFHLLYSNHLFSIFAFFLTIVESIVILFKNWSQIYPYDMSNSLWCCAFMYLIIVSLHYFIGF